MSQDPQNPFNIPSFRSELSEMFDEKLAPITRLVEKHDSELAEHDRTLNQARGARWAFMALWTAISGFLEIYLHWGHGTHKP